MFSYLYDTVFPYIGQFFGLLIGIAQMNFGNFLGFIFGDSSFTFYNLLTSESFVYRLPYIFSWLIKVNPVNLIWKGIIMGIANSLGLSQLPFWVAFMFLSVTFFIAMALLRFFIQSLKG